MNLKERIQAFHELGLFLNKSISDDYRPENTSSILSEFRGLIINQEELNPWFTTENVKFAIKSIAKTLTKENLETWLAAYPELKKNRNLKRIGIIMAGNIPLVGFHDFLSVLICGHEFLGKLSSKDNKLLPKIAEVLSQINPEFNSKINFTEEKVTSINAVIATGSNNTSRYFSYYYGKYPHIIRKNRNGVAVLDGKETKEDLSAMGDDIFCYFGLGCRSVAKLFIPEHYDFNIFFEAIEPYRKIIDHRQYANNYIYNKSIYQLNKIPHYDNGFVLLKEDEITASPVGVIFYEFYSDSGPLKEYLEKKEEEIQNIINHNADFYGIRPGKAQEPALWEYADNVDTLKFLLNLT
jgi:hypothetical protein